MSGVNSYSEQREDWKYRRCGVREREYECVGVKVDGLTEGVAFPLYRRAVLQIPESFYEIIQSHLQTGTP